MHATCAKSCDVCAAKLAKSMDACSRALVFCDGGDGRVTSLSMRHNNMLGTLPTEIGLMTALESMYAFSNGISGTLPTELGRLSSLRIFSVYKNPISGALPTQLGHLSQLTRIVAADSAISAIPSQVGRLTNLEIFNLYRTEVVEGAVPTQLARLTAPILVGEEPAPEPPERNYGAEFMSAMSKASKDEL